MIRIEIQMAELPFPVASSSLTNQGRGALMRTDQISLAKPESESVQPDTLSVHAESQVSSHDLCRLYGFS